MNKPSAMRWFGIVTVALLGGCGGAGDVELGAGRVSPLTLRGRLSLPASAARAGVQSGSWRTEAGEELAVRAHPGERTWVSVHTEVEFLSAAGAARFHQQLGDSAGAIERIDIAVEELTLTEALTGARADTAPVSGAAELAGAVLGPSGSRARLALDEATRTTVLGALAAQRAVSLDFGLSFACPPEQIEALPTRVDVEAVLQPILVMNKTP